MNLGYIERSYKASCALSVYIVISCHVFLVTYDGDDVSYMAAQCINS